MDKPTKKMPNWLYSILCLLLILSLFILMFGVVGNLAAMNKLDLTIVLTLIFFGLGTVSCIASFKNLLYLPFAIGFWLSALAYYFTSRHEVLLAPIIPAAVAGAYLRGRGWKRRKKARMRILKQRRRTYIVGMALFGLLILSLWVYFFVALATGKLEVWQNPYGDTIGIGHVLVVLLVLTPGYVLGIWFDMRKRKGRKKR